MLGMAYKIALTFNERHPVCVEDLKINKLDDEWTRKYSTTRSY